MRASSPSCVIASVYDRRAATGYGRLAGHRTRLV